MKIINKIEDFYQIINKGENIERIIFDFPDDEIILNIENFKIDVVYFHECTLIFKELSFQDIDNKNLLLSFAHCNILCKLSVYNCKIKTFQITDPKSLKQLDINSYNENQNEFELFNFYCGFTHAPIYRLSSDIKISNSIFKRQLRIENVKQINGSFDFTGNIINKYLNHTYLKAKLNDNDFVFSHFSNNLFESKVSFKNTSFFNNNIFDAKKNEVEHNSNVPFFYYTNFNDDVDFTECTFIQFTQFISCNFNKKADFSNSKNFDNGVLLFSECTFYGVTYFNNSFLNVLTFTKCTFEKIASFNQSILNKLFLIQVKFDEVAFFDYIKIKEIDNGNFLKYDKIDFWKTTIRTIKQELQKAENRVDYLRFKAYELDAYSKEKDKNWKDDLILYFNKNSNYFGLDWTKGISFIFQWSFAFYMLYLITFAIVNKTNKNFPQSIEEFSVLYLKFINPLSFLKSPIEDAENFFFPLLFLLLGKIFVSYGIYQTIQAFRKFGVNGG